jgi:hypothetical protein
MLKVVLLIMLLVVMLLGVWRRGWWLPVNLGEDLSAATNFILYVVVLENWDSSVGMAMVGVRFLEGARVYFFLNSGETGFGANLASYPVGTGGKAARVSRSTMVELYLHFPICFHGVLPN